MDAKNYPPTYTTSRRPLLIKLIVGAVLLGVVAYAGYTYFFNNVTELTPEGNYQSTQISNEQKALLKKADITGYLQLTRVDIQDGVPRNVQVANYRPADNTFSFAIDDGKHMNLFPSSSSTGAVLEIDDNTGEFYATTFDFLTDTYEYLPLQENYVSYSAYPSKNNGSYAMDTFRADTIGTDTQADMANWNVRIYDSVNDTSVRFKEAASPQWFNEEKDVIFLKKDGIYRHNLESETTEIIFDLYTNISALARLAVSQSSDYMVLTLPSANTISVLRFEDIETGLVREVARKSSEDTWYRSPVFAPNGTQFAVISVPDVETDTENQNRLEIYSVLDAEPVYTKDMSTILPGELSLTSWNSYEVIAPYKADPKTESNE